MSPQISESNPLPSLSKIPTTLQRSPPNLIFSPNCAPTKRLVIPAPTMISRAPFERAPLDDSQLRPQLKAGLFHPAHGHITDPRRSEFSQVNDDYDFFR